MVSAISFIHRNYRVNLCCYEQNYTYVVHPLTNLKPKYFATLYFIVMKRCIIRVREKRLFSSRAREKLDNNASLLRNMKKIRNFPLLNVDVQTFGLKFSAHFNTQKHT